MVKSINILIALRWTAKAWSQVKPETIMKCFKKAGILNADLDVMSCELGGDDDPFLDADMHTEVQSLIEHTMPANEHCHVEEYLMMISQYAWKPIEIAGRLISYSS